MAEYKPVKEDPKSLKEAENLYNNFIQYFKVGIAIIAVILLVMAGAFVPFSS